MNTVIFGDGPFASMVCFCLQHDSRFLPVAFAVNAAFRTKDRHQDLPVHAFEELHRHFEPVDTAVAIAIGPHDGNRRRAELLRDAVDRGFGTLTYVSTRAITWPGLEIGRNSFVFEGTVVQPFARIGANTIVRSSVHVSHHVEIGDDCFISAGACFGGGAKVGPRVFIGLNATIRDNIEIAEGSVIGAGSVVIANTEPDSVYVGVPARKIRKTE
jgi:sugar O-acyltransferase (sialic acid O-acetyltransferase NeuD family)